MLEIYNAHQDPMEGLRLALRTMNTRGHYVGIAWYERTQNGKPRRSVLMAAPIIEGPELHYLFNGAHSKEIFEGAGMQRQPITIVSDYGDVCVCRVPSRSRKEATVKVDKKTGQELHYHDVRVSGLPVASRPDNHWSNTQVEMDALKQSIN